MDDLIGEFITETTESLSVLDLELVKLEKNPSDDAILSNIFRIVHTIKGTCGFLGLPRLEGVAHASENVLGKIRDRKLEATPQAVSLVLESLDCIKGLIDHLSQHGQEPAGEDSGLIARLNHFADTGKVEGDVAAPAPVAAATAAEAAAPAGGDDFSSFFKGDEELNALIAEYNAKKGYAAQPAAAATPKAELVAKEAPPAVPALHVAEKTAAKPAEKQADAGEGGGVAQSIRVNLDVLENLMQMVGELVLTRNQLQQVQRTREDRDFLLPIQQLSHITTELQEGIMKTRMQPIGNAWSKFPRLVRDLSIELGKKIELRQVGADTELDRQLLEMIKDPLTHMVRNSCDHGLEMPADRKAAGKPEQGTVTLSAFHEGGHIIVEISDDGRGINTQRVKEKAIANGMVTAEEANNLTDQEIMRFIFGAGFSTAEKVTSVSGRGVGMDVVRTNIEKIGGMIELSSTFGKGSKFSVKIPLTLAIVPVLIVEACGEKFALPQINVLELVRISQNGEYKAESLNGAPVMRLREKLLPLGVLGSVLRMSDAVVDWSKKEAFVVVCKVGGNDFGLLVDRVYDTEEIVVKPVAAILQSIPVYSGNTILGDGSVIMILDPQGLAAAIGDSVTGGRKAENEDAATANGNGQHMASFLLFASGKGAPKAVPLELIGRLEEIEVAQIEVAGDEPVVQYRGDLMRLMTLDDSVKIPTEGLAQVIVFAYDRKMIGLVVDSIIDIVHAPYDVKLESNQKGLLGSMIIDDKTVDLVDVANLLGVNADNAKDGKVLQHGRKCSILLVEDSLFFRNITEPYLSAAGYNVTCAESGDQALKLLSQKPDRFNLVITDIEMPNMNGYEFAANCKQSPSLSGLPIMAYTSSVSDEVMKRCKEAGILECISKTDRLALLEAMARQLAGEQEMAA